MTESQTWTAAEDYHLLDVLARLALDMDRPVAEVGARLGALSQADGAKRAVAFAQANKGFLTGPGGVSMTAARAAEGEGRDPDPHVAAFARNARCVHRIR